MGRADWVDDTPERQGFGDIDHFHRPLSKTAIVLLSIICLPLNQALGKPNKKAETQYAPGVIVNWQAPNVEVTGHVVLREGTLELFACSPRTREHESIVVVDAQPLRIFEALGLVGLSPGKPVTLDNKTQAWVPATGDAVLIEVRWKGAGKIHTADIGTWMVDVATGLHLPPGIWRFAGSTRDESDTFLANADGTVICVVDFPTALIAVGELKSADNDSLWVRADREKIPPVGTPVTLVFSAQKPDEAKSRPERGQAKPSDKSTVDRSTRRGNSEQP